MLVLPRSTHAAQTWYENYDEALKAMSAKNYVAAEARLKQAMAERPAAGRKVKMYGTRYLNMYVPQYQLGLVYCQLGRYKEALEQFERADASGVLEKGDKEFIQMAKMVQIAKERTGQVTSQVAATEPKVPPQIEPPKGATVADDVAALVKQAQSLLDQGHLDEARATLDRARRKDTGSKAVSDLGLQIARKEAELEAGRGEEARKAELEKKRGQFQGAMSQADQSLRTKAYPAARQQAEAALATGWDNQAAHAMLKRISVAEKVEALRGAVGSSKWAEAQRLAQELTALDPSNLDLKAMEAEIQKGIGGMATQQLQEEGLVAFYSGEYQQSLTYLERVVAGGQDSAKAHFYVGCAYAGMAFRAQDKRDSLLQKARDAFRRARQLNPTLRYDTRFISPRILDVFKGTR